MDTFGQSNTGIRVAYGMNGEHERHHRINLRTTTSSIESRWLLDHDAAPDDDLNSETPAAAGTGISTAPQEMTRAECSEDRLEPARARAAGGRASVLCGSTSRARSVAATARMPSPSR